MVGGVGGGVGSACILVMTKYNVNARRGPSSLKNHREVWLQKATEEALANLTLIDRNAHEAQGVTRKCCKVQPWLRGLHLLENIFEDPLGYSALKCILMVSSCFSVVFEVCPSA